MNMIKKEPAIPGQIQPKPHRLVSFTLHVLMPIIALAGGIALTLYLLNSGPKARPGKRTPTAILVAVQSVHAGPQKTSVDGMGEIIAAREIEIKPRVKGEVTDINKEFFPGGYFLSGETMAAIDRTDYELVVRQLASDVAKTKSDLALEMGSQHIAEKEYKLLGESVSEEEKNLILRKPQLEKLLSTRDYAQSKLNQARLDLERTEIKAPFNGVIVSRMVDIGAKVTESTVLAKIVGTDSFWLQLMLPVSQLRWLSIPDNSEEKGSMVRIFAQGDSASHSFRTGQVIRLIPALEKQGRMAQLLVKIDDPLCQKKENRHKPKLLLGSYVRAEIDGITITSGISIDRTHIHDDNQVWLMDDNGMLDIRPVNIIFRGHKNVIIDRGIEEGEQLVISPLSAPIEGTPLRLQQGKNSSPKIQSVSKNKVKRDTKRGEKRVN
jgi:RND family efflux transporter MFP subunit